MTMVRRSTLPVVFRPLALTAILLGLSCLAAGQSLGTAGTVSGVVTDPNGAVVPNATVTITNAVTGYTRPANPGTDGSFRFDDVPFNNYRLSVSAGGFTAAEEGVAVRTAV